MKNIYSQIFLENVFVKICIFLLLVSCESLVEDMNRDPNNPTDASPSLILTAAQLANITVHEGHLARVSGMWSGYFTGVDRQYSDVHVYNVTGAGFNDTWKFVYQGVVEQTKLVIEKAELTNNRRMQGIAKVVRANALGAATALWGDIPFTEAADIQNFPNPRFESQIEIYGHLQNLLDDAIADFESGIGSVGQEDIYFQGDANKWDEVAYTLKARFYLETKQYEQARTATLNGIGSPSNSLMAPHGSIQGSNENFMHTFIARGRAGDLDASEALLPMLLNPESDQYRGNSKTDESARFYFYYNNRDNSGGAIATIPNTSSTGVFANHADFPLVTFEENLLTATEALVRTGDFDGALNQLNLYRNHLQSGGFLSTHGVTNLPSTYAPYESPDFANGGMLNQSGTTADMALLKEVLLERYISFYGQITGFNDVRRTRSEEVGVKLTPNAGSTLPERILYSEAEINSNENAPRPVPDIFTRTPVNAQ